MSTLFLDPVDAWSDRFPPLPSTVYEALGGTRVGGPVVHRGRELLFPIPADLRRERGGPLRRLLTMRPLPGIDLRGPTPGRAAIPMVAEGAVGPLDRPEGFITTRGLKAWLAGGTPDSRDLVPVEELWTTGGVAPGVGFAAWADDLGGLASGMVVDRSIALEVAKDGPSFPPPPHGSFAGLALLLLTPARFDGAEGPSRVPGTLVGAATGTPADGAVSAGSVYFYRLDRPADFDAAARKFHGLCVSHQSPEAGFGLAVVGGLTRA